MDTSIFMLASRRALRFQAPNGLLSVEDLWRLPLTAAPGRLSINLLAADASQQLETATKSSIDFVAAARGREQAKTGDTDAELRLEILKFVIKVRVNEEQEEAMRTQKNQEVERLAEALSQKENAALQSMSVEELRARLHELAGK